jgi:hypothetical protein
MIYKLTEFHRQLLYSRGEHSALSEDSQDGKFRLFNKNGWGTIHVKPVAQAPDRMVWYVEYEGEVPAYFKQVLKPVEFPV